MAKVKKSDKLTAAHVVGYGCGDCGGTIVNYMVAGYMARYLQVNLQINAGVLATMLLIWNIWDAVNDPLMGTIMDMSFAKAKPGKDKFRPWILASIPIIMIGMVAFYSVPGKLGGFGMIAAAFILKIVYEAGYTMMNIGMGSLLGNMAKNDNERATLSSARGFGATIAGMVGGFLIAQCLAVFGTTNEGYAKTSMVLAVVGGIVLFLHYFLTEERNKAAATEVVEKTPEQKEAEKFKLSDIATIITKNRAFLALVLHSISVMGVQALSQGATSYMYIDVLKNVSLQGYFSILNTALMVVILMAAPILTKKWDLVVIIRTCLMVGFFSFAGLLAYALLTEPMNPWIFLVWFALSSACVTVSVQMQWGLVAESIDYNEYLTGKRNEGTIYGFFSLSRRVGQTIANSASVLIIAGIGYDASLTNAGLDQAPGTIAGIKIMVIACPMIAAPLSWLCFTFIWNINKDVRAKMAEWKAAKAGK